MDGVPTTQTKPLRYGVPQMLLIRLLMFYVSLYRPCIIQDTFTSDTINSVSYENFEYRVTGRATFTSYLTTLTYKMSIINCNRLSSPNRLHFALT